MPRQKAARVLALLGAIAGCSSESAQYYLNAGVEGLAPNEVFPEYQVGETVQFSATESSTTASCCRRTTCRNPVPAQ